ncbi:MAG TPA: acyl-CoA dehydrogenase family protein [Actinomycetota bacterium]|nr:acyl-CoA dehydrogenase family protein [Actinomycetota bacterium]
MDFAFTSKVEDLRKNLLDFMDTHVYPAEPVYRDQVAASGNPYHHPPIMEELKAEARARGLWNLFLPHGEDGAGLTNLEYAPLAEISGRSHVAPEAMNCAAPDTGNMEILKEYGTPEQQEQWLTPLLAGEIRSAFAMTEPAVASSDATNISSSIAREGDSYVINGRKWWTSGAAHANCKVLIFMGVTNPDAEPYRRQSMVLVPLDTPGVKVLRTLPVFGYEEGHGGHCEIEFTDVRIPVTNLLGEEGGGFAIAQARLGPGRIHHCMRALGMAERAYDLMCKRALTRVAFGKRLAEQGVVRDQIAESRIEIEQTRLLVLKTAWLIDTLGKQAARVEISAIKVAAPRVALNVIDRAIQIHGAMGVSNDIPLAAMYAGARTLRIADGPDDVHKMVIARRELQRYVSELQTMEAAGV